MKIFIVFALIAAVAVATPIKRSGFTGHISELAEIVAAIQDPSTDPATAAALESILLDLLGIDLTPISVGPAIVETSPISVGPAIIEANPIAVGPAMIDFPLPDGGSVTAEEPSPVVVPSPVIVPAEPVVIGQIPAGSSPLVQIIVNVDQQGSAPAVVAPTPVDTPVIDEVYVPGPVNVVDHVVAPEHVINPIQVVDPVIPGPVNVVDNVDAPIVPSPVVIGTPSLPEVVVPTPVIVGTPIIPGPVNIVDNVDAPIVEPVVVGTPIIPAPVVVLPDILN